MITPRNGQPDAAAMPSQEPKRSPLPASHEGFGGGWGGEAGFAGGGAIDESTGDVGMGPMGGSFAQQLAGAAKSVQDALTHGRRRYGILGDKEQQEAGLNRMPTTPGTPSESGTREQPMPGPLAPTSNPFGKRADAGEGEGDQEAIPTDDEETA